MSLKNIYAGGEMMKGTVTISLKDYEELKEEKKPLL